MIVFSCLHLLLLFFFFFFKQKTAYEMRISDWSSDVCSSDLVQLRRLDQFGPVLLQHACALTTFGWFGVGFDGDAPTVGHNDEMAGSLPPSSLLDCSTGVAAGRGQSPRSRVAPGKRHTRRRFGGRHPLCGIGVTSRIAVDRKSTRLNSRH